MLQEIRNLNIFLSNHSPQPKNEEGKIKIEHIKIVKHSIAASKTHQMNFLYIPHFLSSKKCHDTNHDYELNHSTKCIISNISAFIKDQHGEQ